MQRGKVPDGGSLEYSVRRLNARSCVQESGRKADWLGRRHQSSPTSVSSCRAQCARPGTALGHRVLLLDLMELVSGRPSSEWQVTRNQDGKPTLANADGQSAIDVSLSHSGTLALAGITDLGEIGVDLEYRAPRRSISEIAAYAFGPQEQQVVESCGLSAFYRIWTLREALAKACGIGFPMLADGRDYFEQAPKAGTWQSEIDGRRWLFSTGDLPGDYVFSIAIALRSPLDADCEADLTPRQIVRGVN